MLKVKTELGIGKDILYAGEIIKKGQPIWQYVEGFDYQVFMEDIPEDNRDYFDRYSTVSETFDNRYIYFMNGDDCKYMKHSDVPNTMFIGNVAIALKDIEIDEELTCDYRRMTTPTHFEYLKLINAES